MPPWRMRCRWRGAGATSAFPLDRLLPFWGRLLCQSRTPSLAGGERSQSFAPKRQTAAARSRGVTLRQDRSQRRCSRLLVTSPIPGLLPPPLPPPPPERLARQLSAPTHQAVVSLQAASYHSDQGPSMARLIVNRQTGSVPLAVAVALLLTGKTSTHCHAVPIWPANAGTHSMAASARQVNVSATLLHPCRPGPAVLAKRGQQLAARANSRCHSIARKHHH